MHELTRVTRMMAAAVALLLPPLPLLPTTAPALTLDKAEQAAAVSIAARGKAQAGDFKTCAALYHQAYQMDRKVRGYLYSAARCEQKAGLLEKAKQHYSHYLDGAGVDDRLAARAIGHRREVEKVLRQRALARQRAQQQALAQRSATRAAAARAKAAAQRKAKQRAAMMARQRANARQAKQRMAWGSLGGGVAVTAVGGWLMWSASQAIGDLEGKLAKKQNGVIVGIDRETALAEQDSANLRARAGVGVMVVGLAAAGFGTWLLTREETKVSLLPTGRGASLLVRF